MPVPPGRGTEALVPRFEPSCDPGHAVSRRRTRTAPRPPPFASIGPCGEQAQSLDVYPWGVLQPCPRYHTEVSHKHKTVLIR